MRFACCSAATVLVLACAILAQSSHSRTFEQEQQLHHVGTSNNTSNNNSSAPSSNNTNQPYFPESKVVLDMAILSHAIYHLRNKVQSCHDAQSRNKTLINNLLLLQDEIMLAPDEGNNESSSNNDNNNTDHTEPQDIYQLLLPNGTTCLHYSHDYSLGTQVLVVRSTIHNYVAVVYAGTDDWKTTLTDGDILTSDFGPTNIVENSTSNSGNTTENNGNNNMNMRSIFDNVPEGVRVHRGFNSAVFDNDGFHKILNCVSSARLGGYCDDDNGNGSSAGDDANIIDMEDPSSAPYQLFTTGHSLGAADSVLLGAALHLAYPNETMRSINFGCPKIGNTEWSFWIDSLQPDHTIGGRQDNNPSVDNSDSNDSMEPHGIGSFEVFRFVNKIDLVPRLPELCFTHAGHTLQMSVGGDIRAYYDHLGNEDFGYAGVPFGWEAASYALLPGALSNHMMRHYVKYLTFYRPEQPNSTLSNLSTLYYVRDFERIDDLSEVYSSTT
ncbi:hypothetical protein ACHAXR_008733 [Thalassiosira sp. AJA248-18]